MLISFGKGEPTASDMVSNLKEIFVVDDEFADLGIGEDACGQGFRVVGLTSVSDMFASVANGHRPQMVFLDADMPDVDGFEALDLLRNDPLTRGIPVVMVTAKHDQSSALRAIKMGAADHVPKPFLPLLIQNRVSLHLRLRDHGQSIREQVAKLKEQNVRLSRYRSFLSEAVNRRTGKMADLQTAILQTVSDLVAWPAGVNGQGHPRRRELGVLLGALNEQGICLEEGGARVDRDVILQSSRLHDVGKMAIEESILNKPGRLTAEEFEAIKKHTVFGVDILDRVGASRDIHQFLRLAKVFAGTHHERWDGSGYPCGLRGEEIPLAGRMMAIADVYDGLTSVRPWKKAFSHAEAVREIVNGKGSHFDPLIVDVFSDVADEFRASA
ncbi:MAG: response regulator [Deltaproteobacteria bacterium]|nr:response regulator [Deltaproteobacteria bacterium]